MSTAFNRRAFLLTSGAAALLGGCETSDAPAAPSAPSTPSKPSTPSTPLPATATVFPLIADTAQRLDVAKARTLKAHGVKTVFRYYSQLPPSIAGKDLQPEETKIILGEGLSLATVFQHYNNCFRTFENNWGKEDAEQSLRMAKAAGQPSGSAIYFGVDADWPYQQLRDPIIKYFEDVKRAFEGSGIAVGVYSNGCICNAIREKGLAQYFWLSGSTGHSGTQAFYNTGQWTLFQNALDVTPPQVGYAIDSDIANPTTNGYFGQWNDRGAEAAAHSAAETSAVLGARRFLNANVEVIQDLNPGSASLVSLKKDQNVRVTGASGQWTR
ncbi:MAG TPA: glycoside hydrolase domain-containing protein, partial [Hyphomonadaceae bacterium]|nr:glycoside hydrolase domain-containing protein [Hyphomonadaceae bacterium]